MALLVLVVVVLALGGGHTGSSGDFTPLHFPPPVLLCLVTITNANDHPSPLIGLRPVERVTGGQCLFSRLTRNLFKADKKSFQGLYPLPLGNLRHASTDQVGFEKPIPGIRFQTKLSLLCSLPGWISCTGCLLYCTQHNVSGGEDDILKATRYQNRSALPPRLTLHHNSAHWLERKNLQAKGRQFSMDDQWAFQ